MSAGVPLRERRWSMPRLSHQADSRGQAEAAARRHERRAVVSEDPLQNAVQLEQPLEELQRLLQHRRAADVHRENEAAVLVPDHERLAALEVAEPCQDEGEGDDA